MKDLLTAYRIRRLIVTGICVLSMAVKTKKGKHEVVFPKVKLPVSTDCVPIPASSDYGSCFGLFHGVGCHIAGLDEIPLYEDTWHGAVIRGVKDAACAFDIVTDPAVQELTVEEIEKRLGYKVKIVSKEEKK